jgi:hypothetical protein
MSIGNITKRWVERTVDFGRARRTRKIALIIAAVVVFYGLLGYFGGPILIRHIASGSVAKSLERPVSVGRAVLNPYTLNLNLYKIRIGEQASQQSFINIARLHVKVSWTSLFHLAPIVSLLTIEQPMIHIVRIDERRFNFSDLIESRQPTPAAPSKPRRFAISNIRVNEGEIQFDDKVLGQHHTVTHVEIGVPFIANLPADTNIYVQPLLMMVIDGSPFRLAGKAKPFSTLPESVLNLNLRRLDLSRYAAYLPRTLAIELPQGALSCALQVHFVAASPEPRIRLAGEIALDQLNVRDGAGAPLVSLDHASMELNEVEPLREVAAFGAIHVDGLTTYIVRKHDGMLNFTSLTSKGGAPGRKAQGAGIQPQPALQQPQNPAKTTPGAATGNQSPAPTSTASPAASTGASSAVTPSPFGPPAPATHQAGSTPNSSATAQAANEPPSAIHSTAAATVSTSGTHATGVPKASPSPPPSAPASSATIMPRPASTTSPVPVSAPQAKAQTNVANVSVQSVTVANSTMNITDDTGAKPAKLALEKIHISIQDLHTVGTTPATLDMGANLSGGGSLAVKGTLDLPQSNATADIRLDQVNLSALQAFAQSLLTADVASGQLSAHGNARMNLAAGHFNVDLRPATVVIDQVQIRSPGGGENPISWSRLSTTIGELNLAKREANINEIRADGLHLFVRRERDGHLSLASLMPGAAPPTAQSGTTPHPNGNVKAPAVAPPWQFRVTSLILANNDIHMRDETVAQPVDLTVAPLNLHVTGASSDFSKAVGLEVDGIVDRRGSFKISGNATPKPITAQLHVNTQNLDVAAANPYVASHLNTTIIRALLTMNGAFSMTDQRGSMFMAYRGDATLGNVQMLDKVTSQSFMGWGAFNARRIDFRLGQGNPRIHVGALSLSNFYGDVILNSNGRLNLSDIMGSPQAPPTSLTRANTGAIIVAQPPGARAPAPTAKPRGKPAIPGKPLKADIAIGGVTLQEGHINYADYFIKPNYRANLTHIKGKVGGFGSASTTPAEVDLRGRVSRTAPLEISGSINPLTPMTFVDITAKADGVELPDFTPYSSKYTGYPITKGTLTVNVHYLLKKQELTAQNHIRLDQLTFGPRVQGKSVLNLPIRLAVALLKNPQGQINLDIPVAGSLSDPQFSIGGVILGVLKNLILKAATSPFTLLASAVGGIGGNEQLKYIEFKPGYATLSPESKKKLNTLAKALNARPALQLDISGRVDPEYDRGGLHYAMLDRLIKEQKIKELANKGENVNPAEVEVTQADYDKYLKRVYKAAKFEKPRDFLGLDKSLPPDEMKKLLIAHITVTDADLKRLADKRAEVVHQQLAKQVDPARLFIIAPKLNAEGIKGKGKTMRVDLSLD